MKRMLDILVSLIVLTLVSSFMLAAMVAIKLTSPGPIFYRAIRLGQGGVPFTMWKFRTMHVLHSGVAVSAGDDPRIFRVGTLLRRLKIDELPQFFNVLAGNMAVVGPRPRDPGLVEKHYTPEMRESLMPKPGLTSPGTLYYYARADLMIDPARPEESYAEMILPIKLALDRAYFTEATIGDDLYCIWLTVVAISRRLRGIRTLPPLRWRLAAAPLLPAQIDRSVLDLDPQPLSAG